MTNIPLQPIKLVPHWLAMTLCILFAILYAVWLLPNTIFIRNTCLIAGAVLSLWLIFQNSRIFYQRRTWPILLIAGLLVWVSIHLFFIGLEFDTQYAEYTKIWKKIALGCIFAIGLGLAIGSHFADDKKSMQYWLIVRIAFLLPVTIYFLKLIINTWAAYKGIELSPYLQDSRAIFTDPYAIARPGYVFFILPAIALAIGTMTNAIESNRFAIKNHLLDLASMVLTIACLFIEHDKLGVLLVILLLLAAGYILTKGMAKQLSRQNLLILFFGLLAVLVIGLSSYRQNAQWSTLIADAKVAVQVDAIDDWKYESAKSENAQHEVIERLPVNEYGQKVNVSNYQRIAWAVVGSRLTVDHPLGYGLMSQSFGRWCKLRWPESHNSWAHNAWLDFTLGYGYPGTFLLLVASILAWRNSKAISGPWNILGCWGFGIMACTLFFKELSSEIYFNAYIFVLIWVATLALVNKNKINNAKPN